MKKEINEITFEDGIKGTNTTERYKGYTITGNERTGFVALDIHGHFSSKVYKTEEEAIVDIEKDIADSVPFEESENEILPTPSSEPKTEEEEEAELEYFVKQMSEPAPEFIGHDYMDARRMNNWKKLLLDKLYENDRKHEKIYCNTKYGKIIGWFWSEKGSKQFQRLYGGKIQEVDSNLYFIDEFHYLFLEIICEVEIEKISIESQLIESGELHKGAKPAYIFECLQSHTFICELELLLCRMCMNEEADLIRTFYKIAYRELEKEMDYETTLLVFCKNMEYLTERIIAYALTQKEGENNDNC